MSLFQKTIITKYLKSQSQENLNQKWDLFCSHFHNPEIQENIRNSKEEQYQGEFLIDLFVNVLGYTKNPTPNFNLTTEYKNVKDSKKADGAIIINDKVLAIIELKGTDTTDLGKVESQAFGYKNNQPDCKYVVTSNFEKLRFYIDNAIEHLEFNLFELTKEQFELLYLCLAFENISADIPAKIKNESVSKEDEITKKLYKDYSVFKRELFNNLIKQNPEFDQLELFKKSQKLLDRLLFLFFGEDRGLLPPNSVRLILEQWNKLKELDEYKPLYERFQKYFGYLNTGFKGKQFDVFAYNGGLFRPDEILDHITIDDTLLYNHTLKLAEYDFASEVDVNILGHIFENSLNEIDEIKAQIEGQEIDKSKTKRKKDGVFYTPKYITKYIVENTVGKLCDEKKTEIGIAEEDYFTDKKRQQKTKLALLKKLEDYRTWLHQITIIDPACGSGAFLNEALNFLIEEHKYIDELDSKLNMKFGTFGLEFNIENSILENNLFGVDLNEESVEIAKLSLWLRTAKPNRKLNDLSNNIKCGNSLIDDPEIAGEKAFNWEKEFPQIFAKGGFDVVIGNPPWNSKINNTTSNAISSRFNIELKNLNMFAVFFYLGNLITKKETGIINLLIPEVIIKNSSYKNLRNLILNEFNLYQISDFGQFPGVASNTVSVGYVLKKELSKTIIHINKNNFEKTKVINSNLFNQSPIIAFSFDINESKQNLLNKLSYHPKISELIKIKRGIEIGQVTELVLCDNCKKYSEISTKYYSNRDNNQCKFCNSKINRINKISISSRVKNDFYSELCYSGKEINRFTINNNYYIPLDLNGIDYKNDIFSDENLFIKRIATKPEATIINKRCFAFNTLYCLYEPKNNISKKYLLILLNSRILEFYYEGTFNLGMSLTTQLTVEFLKQLPIKEISLENQQPFIEKADQMLLLNKELQELSEKFQRNLQREFSLETLSKKLQNWYELSFADFLKELAKAKVNLTLSQKAEWEDYFLQEQKRALDRQSKVHTTDKEIDQMVYELYGLTEEEIEIVEKS